jgi:alkylation response protein AidB-like acyl-CoA dehydrogenase
VLAEAPQRILAAVHQVHGGVGFIRDHPLHMYFGRSKAAALSLGPLSARCEGLAGSILDQRGVHD